MPASSVTCENGHISDASPTQGLQASQGTQGKSRLVFMGTGVSTAIPALAHLLGLDGIVCDVCQDARRPGSRNRRNNVSLLIQHANPDSGFVNNVLVDMGKTFRDAAMNVLVPLGVAVVDAILITHDHADAMGGMDDARDLQPFDKIGTSFMAKHKLPIYLSKASMDVLTSSFPYIVEASAVEGPIPRRVAQLDFHILQDDPLKTPETLCVAGLEITALPVYHGGEYIAFGFVFGKQTRVLYLSDVSKVPEGIQQYIDKQVIDILIVDCLHKAGMSHFSHFCLDDALAFAKRIDPSRVYFVGMFCDLDHDTTNAFLASQVQQLVGSRIQSMELAFDGLCLDVDL